MTNQIPEVSQLPADRLTRDQEAALCRKIAHKDEDALNLLVMHNMREALLYTARVTNGQIDEATRLSLCYQEMIMSARRFKPGKGRPRFFGFAKVGLRGRMKRYYQSLRPVRNADSALSLDAMAKEPVRQTVLRVNNRTIPHTTGEEINGYSHRETVTGEMEGTDWDLRFARDHWGMIRTKLDALLSAQQWMVIDLAYFKGWSFSMIANKLNLTRSAVQAAHKKAIKKLRDGVAANPQLLYVEDTGA